MPIYRGFVVEEPLFVRAVCHRHNVHVLKFRAGFAPVAMSQDVVPANFAAGFNFAPGGHRPMKQSIEARDADPGLRRFHVFQNVEKRPMILRTLKFSATR